MRDSSLSAPVQAIVAAEVGHLDLAYDYFGEAALVDLLDLAGNTRDGLHIASLAGTWLAAVAGFGGMRDHDEELAFAPRLPEPLTRLAFRLVHRGRRLCVEVHRREALYELTGEPLAVRHHGEALELVRESAPSVPSRRRRRGRPAAAARPGAAAEGSRGAGRRAAAPGRSTGRFRRGMIRSTDADRPGLARRGRRQRTGALPRRHRA